MQKTDKQIEEDERLAVIISDRIHQAMEAFPDHFRRGRGRIEDFTSQYELTRGLARRILEGRGLPPPRLLCRIAEDLGITTDWLCGLSDEPIASMRESRGIRIDVWSPVQSPGTPKAAITVPRNVIPNDLAARRLVAVAWPDHSCQPYVGPGDMVLVQPRTDIFAGAHHLVAWHHGRLDAARIATYASADRLMLQIVGGRAETLNTSDVTFGLDDIEADPTVAGTEASEGGPASPTADGKRGQQNPLLRVVGLIVGRLCFNETGLQMIEPPR